MNEHEKRFDEVFDNDRIVAGVCYRDKTGKLRVYVTTKSGRHYEV